MYMYQLPGFDPRARAMLRTSRERMSSAAFCVGKWAHEHKKPLAIGAAVVLIASFGVHVFWIGPTGPAADSLAAITMSAIARSNEIGVTAGSVYSILQSWAMGKSIYELAGVGVTLATLAAVGDIVGEDSVLRPAADKVSEAARFSIEACKEFGATAEKSAVNACNQIGASAARYLSSPEGIAMAKSALAVSPFLLAPIGAPIGAPLISSWRSPISFAIARSQGVAMGKPALSSLLLSPLAIARDQGEASRVAA